MHMKRRLLFALPILALVAFLWATSSSDEQQLADELAAKQSRTHPSDQATINRLNSGEVQLTELIQGLRGEDGMWQVDSVKSTTTIDVPFKPTVDGSLPPAEPVKPSPANAAKTNPGFVGANACAACHEEKHRGFITTAHHKTSSLATPESTAGKFAAPLNQVTTSDPSLSFTLADRAGRCYQDVQFANWKLSVPMDVQTGSAKTGQSYLFWHGDALFQNHVSYVSSIDEWVTSPGYEETAVMFDRPIRAACLECHITYIKEKRDPNFFEAESAIWGISCERCHGPGKDHIDYHLANPSEKVAKHIVHPKSLSRHSQMELCGQCHSGTFELLGEAFSYRPGDDLSKHHKHASAENNSVGGIHTSNQLTRLVMSKCYQQSEMTCTTCHNPHVNQRGDTQAFTQSCLSCHEIPDCGKAKELGEEKIRQDCISCHMPIGDNQDMNIKGSQGDFVIQMIDHYIRITP
jgi:Cytochrome c554 and c-prime